MGDNNINKLSFFQKVELAKQNLKAQGKTAPTTADIVNEMVNITKAEKAEELPEGFKIEHIAATRGNYDEGKEVYGTPNIPISTSLTLMLNVIQKLSIDTTISQEGKQEIVDILLSMVELIKTGRDVPPEIIDIIKSLSIEIPTEVYDTPEVLYGTPDIIDNPTVKTMLDFLNKFMANKNIPDEIKSQMQDIFNNLTQFVDPRNSVTEFLLLASNKLITDNNLPQNIINEFINILNEVEGIDGRITSENGILICVKDKPDIANDPKYEPLFNLIEQIMNNSNIPDEIKGKIQALLLHPDNVSDPAKSIQAIILDALKQLITDNDIAPEIMDEIINLVNNLGLEIGIQVNGDVVVLVYDSPEINPKVQGLLKFLGDIMSSDKLSDEIKAKIKEIISQLSGTISPDATIAEMFLAIVNKLFSEMELDDETKQAVVDILSNVNIEDDLSGIEIQDGYCVYDTPDIRKGKLKLVLDILDKIKAQDSQIPENYKYELTLLLKEIIIELVGRDNIPPEVMAALDEFLGINNTGVNDTTSGKKLEGTQKMLVSSEEEFFAKHPADKYEIVHKMTLGHNMLMIFYREK